MLGILHSLMGATPWLAWFCLSTQFNKH